MNIPVPGSATRVEADPSAALLQLVFDHAGEGISVFDGALCMVAWNQRFLDATGLAAAEVYKSVPLLELLRSMARRGEFGPCDIEAEAQRRLLALGDRTAALTQRTRPNGRTLELRRNPTPDGGFVMLYADITERVDAEAALADEQRMLALLQQRTEQGFWFIDNQQRTIDVNPAMCRLLGLPREALLGRSIFDFVDEAQAAVFRDGVHERELGHASGYEITLRRSDGSSVHCYNNATPIVDAQGRKVGALGLLSNITPFKQVEQQLREAGEQLAQKSQVLSATLDGLDQGLLSLDPEGRINSWNRRALELLEVPEAAMRSCTSLDELLRYQTENGLLDPALGGGLDRPARYQRRRRDGTVLEVRTHAAADGSVVRTYTDVTADLQAQQALLESEDRFRSMADAAPALIWLSSAEGKPTWFNQLWLQQTGRSMEAELACPWAERMHADDLQGCREAYRKAVASRSGYAVEYRLRRHDGSLIWVVDNGIPRVAGDGSFAGYIVYGWDITERKASEVALRAAKEEAERANRAKSEFLSRMSHELRTPLNAVLGFAQLLEADTEYPLVATQRSRVQELMRGGRHLLSLINDVLDLSRIEAGALQLQLSAVDLPELVRDCLRLVQPMAGERGITLELSTAPQPAAAGPERAVTLVHADATRLKQVLLNLLSNAIKYNRDNGHVQVSWHDETATDTLRIDVVDTGPGISAAQQERLFQAFERLNAANTTVEGAGIGLALSKWLVDLMRGEIGVDSAPGQGSRFWVRLARKHAGVSGTPGLSVEVAPDAVAELAAAPVALTVPAPPENQAPVSGLPRSTVLYIEDNEVNQMLMEGMLAQRRGLRLLLASLPEAGLSMAAVEQPDLILLDIQLPGIDGFEVLRRLRALPATQAIPVVAVSANAMQADLDAAQTAGFNDYVTKPLELQRLLSVVDRLLGR